MSDMLFAFVVAAFAALSWALFLLCDRLMGGAA